MKFSCSYSKIVPVENLIKNPDNPNDHPKKQIEMLAKIIDFQGQRSPVVVSNQSGFIVKGHGRLEAIELLGWENCAVDFQDYESPAQEYADMIADNKIAELAKHNDRKMIESLDKLNMNDWDLNLLGLESLKVPEVNPSSGESVTDDEKYIIIIECKDELNQQDLYEEFKTREIDCKLMS